MASIIVNMALNRMHKFITQWRVRMYPSVWFIQEATKLFSIKFGTLCGICTENCRMNLMFALIIQT